MKIAVKLLFISIALVIFSSCNNETKSEGSGTLDDNSAKYDASVKQGQAFIADDGSKPTVLQIAMKSDDHTTLVAAVEAADLENSLSNAGPLTVFAPTNAAFDALPAGTVENLLKPENKEKLAYILKHHVTPGNYGKDFMKKFKTMGQASNENVIVEVKGDDVYVGGAKVLASIAGGNGIVHVVDKVILPSN